MMSDEDKDDHADRRFALFLQLGIADIAIVCLKEVEVLMYYLKFRKYVEVYTCAILVHIFAIIFSRQPQCPSKFFPKPFSPSSTGGDLSAVSL